MIKHAIMVPHQRRCRINALDVIQPLPHQIRHVLMRGIGLGGMQHLCAGELPPHVIEGSLPHQLHCMNKRSEQMAPCE